MMTTTAAPMYKPVPLATGAGACAAPILPTSYRRDQGEKQERKNENMTPESPQRCETEVVPK